MLGRPEDNAPENRISPRMADSAKPDPPEHRRSEPDTEHGPEGAGSGSVDDEPYKRLEGPARTLKATLQMLIGAGAIIALGAHFVVHWLGPGLPSLHKATTTLLGGIGAALAAAAVVELAYTLFTPGPDEVLDPLMLGVAAGLLLLAGGLESGIQLSQAVAFLVLGILLAMLFATRLWLVEVSSGKTPQVWWIRQRAERTQADRSPSE